MWTPASGFMGKHVQRAPLRQAADKPEQVRMIKHLAMWQWIVKDSELDDFKKEAEENRSL